MPLKRITPSFTVEFRHSKRSKLGNVRPSWVNERTGPTPPINESRRAAAAIFKHDDIPQTDDGSSATMRILPSLTERDSLAAPPILKALGAAREARKRFEPRTIQSGEGNQGGHRGRATDDGVRAESLEEPERVPVGREPQLETQEPQAGRIAKARNTARKGGTAKPTEQLKREPDRAERLDSVRGTSYRAQAAAKAKPTPEAVSPRAAGVRKARVLRRHVLRDDFAPGDGWKRRIQTQRDRRR
jgi:hypothetical protein